MHEEAPNSSWNLPESHCSQALAPTALENEPGEQRTQRELPSPEYLPITPEQGEVTIAPVLRLTLGPTDRPSNFLFIQVNLHDLQMEACASE